MKTHCKHGHEYTESNTIWGKQKNGSPRRKCRACGNSREVRAGSRANDRAKRTDAARHRKQLIEHINMERAHALDYYARSAGGFGTDSVKG